MLFIFFLIRRRPPRSTLFSYTTLFRSASADRLFGELVVKRLVGSVTVTTDDGSAGERGRVTDPLPGAIEEIGAEVRSEEHTSELQSHVNLVCRLLLEKKKTIHVQLNSL